MNEDKHIIKFCSCSSGSSGNSYIVATNDAAILVDAGTTGKNMIRGLEKCGLTPADVDAIFLTHEHHDHIRGLPVIVKEINKVIPENMKPLEASKVTQWLVSAGYLEEQEKSDGHKYKSPTGLGTSIGITSAWRDGSQGQYLAISYDANAQHFILENLFKL